MSQRRIEYMALAEIQRAPRNPKTHDEDSIKASLSRFGLGDLPVIDERTGLLAAGHGRIKSLQALRDADKFTPPGGVVLADDGDWLVPVVRGWASADDREADAYLVTQRLSERGGWDTGALADVLTCLDGHLDGLGVDQHELDELLLSLLPTQPADPAHKAPSAGPSALPSADRPDTADDGPGNRAIATPLPTGSATRQPSVFAPMSFPTTSDQRDTVQAALDLARRTGHGDQPAEALAAICQFFIDYAEG